MKHRKILWLMLWLFSLILLSFRGGAAAYGFFFFCTLIPVICLLYLLAVVLEFSIYQELETKVMTAGEPFSYTFTLQNEGWITISSIRVLMYADLSNVEKLPEGITFELLPGESFRFDTKMVCKYRGQIKVGVSKLVITDFLKLFTITYKVREPLEAIVDPRIPDEEEYNWEEEMSKSYRQENRLRKDVPDYGVRAYEAGDPLRRINWRATAANGKLMTRELIGEEQESVTVLFDAGRYSEKPLEYLPVENHILELVLSLSQHFCLKGQPVTVGWLQKTRDRLEPMFFEVTTLQEFALLYEEMKKLAFLSHLTDEQRSLLYTECARERQGGRIFAVLRKEEAENPSLEELKNAGAELYLIPAEEGVER